MQPDDVSYALIQQGEKERLGKTPSSSSTTAWWWWRSAGLQQGFAKHCKRRGGIGVGLHQGEEKLMSLAAPKPPLFIGEGERGPASLDTIYKGAAAKGGTCHPSKVEAPPPLGFPNPMCIGPLGGAPAH